MPKTLAVDAAVTTVDGKPLLGKTGAQGRRPPRSRARRSCPSRAGRPMCTSPPTAIPAACTATVWVTRTRASSTPPRPSISSSACIRSPWVPTGRSITRTTRARCSRSRASAGRSPAVAMAATAAAMAATAAAIGGGETGGNGGGETGGNGGGETGGNGGGETGGNGGGETGGNGGGETGGNGGDQGESGDQGGDSRDPEMRTAPATAALDPGAGNNSSGTGSTGSGNVTGDGTGGDSNSGSGPSSATGAVSAGKKPLKPQDGQKKDAEKTGEKKSDSKKGAKDEKGDIPSKDGTSSVEDSSAANPAPPARRRAWAVGPVDHPAGSGHRRGRHRLGRDRLLGVPPPRLIKGKVQHAKEESNKAEETCGAGETEAPRNPDDAEGVCQPEGPQDARAGEKSALNQQAARLRRHSRALVRGAHRRFGMSLLSGGAAPGSVPAQGSSTDRSGSSNADDPDFADGEDSDGRSSEVQGSSEANAKQGSQDAEQGSSRVHRMARSRTPPNPRAARPAALRPHRPRGSPPRRRRAPSWSGFFLGAGLVG